MSWYSIAQALGAPPAKTEEYYKNWVLNFLFILPAIFSGLFVLFGVFNTAFFVCLAIVAVIVFFSSERRVLLGTTLAFVALRFAIGAVIPRQCRLTSLL